MQPSMNGGAKKLEVIHYNFLPVNIPPSLQSECLQQQQVK